MNDPQKPKITIPVPGMEPGKVAMLGDLMKRATSAMGVKPCLPCQKRAEALNRMIGFKGR